MNQQKTIDRKYMKFVRGRGSTYEQKDGKNHGTVVVVYADNDLLGDAAFALNAESVSGLFHRSGGNAGIHSFFLHDVDDSGQQLDLSVCIRKILDYSGIDSIVCSWCGSGFCRKLSGDLCIPCVSWYWIRTGQRTGG